MWKPLWRTWARLVTGQLWSNERGLIGTAAAIGIGIAAAAGQTIASVHGTRTAGRENRRAVEAQQTSERTALDIEREALANDRAQQEEAQRIEQERVELERQRHEDNLAFERQRQADALALQREQDQQRQMRYQDWLASEEGRWGDYIKANQPTWNIGNQAFGQAAGLMGLAGAVPRGAMPPPGTRAPVAAPPPRVGGPQLTIGDAMRMSQATPTAGPGRAATPPPSRGRSAFSRLAPQSRMNMPQGTGGGFDIGAFLQMMAQTPGRQSPDRGPYANPALLG